MDLSDAALDRFSARGDPLADGVVAELVADRTLDDARRLLHDLLRTNQAVPPGMPNVVTDYLERTAELPPHDPDQIRRAQRFFVDFGVPITLALFCASLPSAYASWRGVKVLHLTARLETDVRRRIMETGQFLMDVMTPGGLGEGGQGVRAIQRVRLVHATVRHLIDAAAASDPSVWSAEWGRPLNQEELAGTLMSFSYVVAEPLPRLGLAVTAEDAEAYRACWNVVGAMLGIDPRLLPASMAESAELVATVRRRQFGASPEGADLTTALIAFLEHHTPGWDRRHLVPAIIRQLVTDDVADLLEVPTGSRSWWDRLSLWLLRLLGRFGADVDRSEHRKEVWEPFAILLLRSAFAIERGKDDAAFDLPDHLAAAIGR